MKKSTSIGMIIMNLGWIIAATGFFGMAFTEIDFFGWLLPIGLIIVPVGGIIIVIVDNFKNKNP